MKRTISLLVVFLLAFLLGACGNNQPDGSIAPLPEGTNTAAFFTQMHYVPRGYNVGAYNSTGYYYIATLPDGGYNIRYIDYENLLDVCLCNRPECMHSDETCAAWGHPEEAQPFLIATETELILVM